MAMLAYDVGGTIKDYSKSTLLKQFDFHFKQFSGSEQWPLYKTIYIGHPQRVYQAIAKYNDTFGGITWDNLHSNAYISLLSLNIPAKDAAELVQYDDFMLLDTLNSLANAVQAIIGQPQFHSNNYSYFLEHFFCSSF